MEATTAPSGGATGGLLVLGIGLFLCALLAAAGLALSLYGLLGLPDKIKKQVYRDLKEAAAAAAAQEKA